MNPRILTVNKLSAAVAAAALMGGASNAAAVPVNLTLDYQCPLPLIGDDLIVADVSSDLPESVEVGEGTGAFDLVADTTIAEKSRSGLKLVNTATISGVANADALLETTGLNLPLTVPLEYPETTVPAEEGPFTVIASGSTPSLTFQSSQAGTVTISVGNMELVVDTRTPDGSATGLGEFTSNCTLTSSDTILHQFEVTDGPQLDPADIAVSTESVDFGNTQAGTSSTQTVTISNEGDLDLGINGISVDGDTEFSQTNSCTTIAGGESCDVQVTFAPSTEGARSAQLNIASTDADEANVAVDLAGAGELEPTPEIEVESTGTDFGTVDIGDPANGSITVTNTGNGPLTVNNVDFTGDDAFNVDGSACIGAVLASGESCTVNVDFTPGSEDSFSGNVTITSDDEDEGSVSVGVSGEGFDPNGGGGGGTVVPVLLDLEGSTTIARSGSTLPITGSIASELTLPAGTVEADLSLDPTEGNFAVIRGWNSWASTAQIEFEQTRMTTGELVDGKLTTSSEMYINVPKVTVPVFGFDVKIGGGEECRTSSTVAIDLASAEGTTFSPSTGGQVVGTYDLPELENCGFLTGLLNGYMAGPGNTLDLDLTVNN